jgi:hypothetical protein
VNKMSRTKGSLNRPKEVREADKARAAACRAYRAMIDAGPRGRLPHGVKFSPEMHYTRFKQPKPAAAVEQPIVTATITATFDEASALVVV